MNTINPEEVDAAFQLCLIDDQEESGAEITVDGIRGPCMFHPDRLEANRNKVVQWLSLLPHQFQKNGGGGWSFLNACTLENGDQWTGLHERMEELFCLGIGLGIVRCLLPRDLWNVFPGGMPYYVVDLPVSVDTGK